jgi:sigma-B regulation protein RsbU (phosphoserine phosphatase)
MSDEDRRTAAVRKYSIDTSSGHALDKIACLAARIFGAPMAGVAIVDSDRVRLIASHGPVGATQTVRVPGLPASAVPQPDPYVVADAATDPRTVDHPSCPGSAPGPGSARGDDTALLALSEPVPPASPHQENR